MFPVTPESIESRIQESNLRSLAYKASARANACESGSAGFIADRKWPFGQRFPRSLTSIANWGRSESATPPLILLDPAGENEKPCEGYAGFEPATPTWKDGVIPDFTNNPCRSYVTYSGTTVSL